MTSTDTDPPGETTIERLVRERGPLPLSDSPYGSYTSPSSLRGPLSHHSSVMLLWPTTSGRTNDNSYSPTMAHDAVLYHDEHEPRDVVETWLDENPQILDRASSWAVYMSLRYHGSDERIAEAACDVLRERDPDGWNDNRR